jgi:hypothetical protein
MVYTTSLSPRSWEKLTASKSKLREKTDKLILRPDLDALAEVFVCLFWLLCLREALRFKYIYIYIT